MFPSLQDKIEPYLKRGTALFFLCAMQSPPISHYPNKIMNKKILYAVAACTVLFSSCGGANGKPSTVDANAIIEYNNTSLEVLKSLYSERETNNVLEYMEKHSKTPFAPVIVSKIGVARDTAQMTAPGDCFSSGVRDSLKTSYSAYFTAGEKFFANYDAY